VGGFFYGLGTICLNWQTEGEIGVRTSIRFIGACVLSFTLSHCVPTGCVLSGLKGEHVWAHDLKDHPWIVKYSTSPVNARVDRVWHAIPGLCGWKIDEAASQDATNQYRDGKIHLVWKPQEPTVRLADLPASPIYRGPQEEKSVCLMFNVSWGEAYVESLLNTLRKESVHATFFLDGAWVTKFPELAKRIRAEGHAIGSHGTGHPDFTKLSNQQLGEQILGSQRRILNTVGVMPTLLAPPAGAYDQRCVKIARAHHVYTILWTVDTVDWQRPPASTIVKRVLHGVSPGALILMHPTQPTTEALPTVIRRLKAGGFAFKTVSQLVREERVVSPPTLLE
jgi:probable sporulation protein (polysaccharide deacetylase family)